MSAICGLFHRDGAPASAQSLTPTLDALAHYGDLPPSAWVDPDGGAVALGAVVNALTPQDTLTRQPVTRGAYTIAADARIDNRADLFAALDVPSALHADLSDAALIVMAYAKWDTACVDHLIGDFAFALWDADARRLFCGRDPIGARPFYYHLTPRLFAFATELPALLALPGVEAALDEAEITRLLLSARANTPQTDTTYWRDTMRLPFGCSLVVSADAHRQRRYYDFAPRPRPTYTSIDDYADALYALIDTSVRDRLRLADGIGVGAHCSGGVDSSAVAVLVARARGAAGLSAPLLYSWSPPPEPGADIEATEHRRIERLVRREGLTVHYTESRGEAQGIDPALYPLNTLGIEQAVQPRAAAAGARVLFSGWGGDEGISFNGRGIVAGWLVGGQWARLARWLPLDRAVTSPREARRAIGRLWERAIVPALPEVLYDALIREHAAPYIHPDLAARTAGVRARRGVSARERAGVASMQRRLLAHGHVTQRMECWAWAGARHGITYVYPLTDRRILDFALSLPPELYLDASGRGRYLYRYTVSRLLGEAFVWDTIKQDTALFARAEAGRADAPAEGHIPLTIAESECPWVDLPRLRAAYAGGRVDVRSAEGVARVAASEALTIWRHRQGRT